MNGQRRGLMGRRAAAVAAAAVALLLLLGCASAGGRAGRGKLQVVAAENFWGSIAAQVGGDRVQVTSIIYNPDADPHVYEPTAADGRAVAGADYVIVNGAGYDGWASRLLQSTPSPHRRRLVVGDVVGVGGSGNPHLWYSPAFVHRAVDRITADLKAMDPGDAASFDRSRSAYLSTGLAAYERARSDIQRRFAGAPVGATESIFVYMARDLGLDLTTPPGFMNAISEGVNPTAQDKATFDGQVGQGQIRVLVFNRQNSTPDVDAIVREAVDRRIPVVSITETLKPADATFQDWQAAQLQQLDAALARAAS